MMDKANSGVCKNCNDHMREKLEILRHKLAGMISAAVEPCDEGECCESCKYFHSTACTDYLIADFLIANGVTVQEWIPVTQRRPDEELAAEKAAGGHVYGCLMIVRSTMFPTRTFVIAGFYEQDFYTHSESPRFLDANAKDVTDLVTHWMPKPAKPRGA